MKRKLLFTVLAVLPVLAFSQIKIGDTEYATLQEAVDVAVASDNAIITINGAITTGDVTITVPDDSSITIKGISADARIEVSQDKRIEFNGKGKSTVEDLTVVGAKSTGDKRLFIFSGSWVVFKNDTIRDAENDAGHGGAILIHGGAGKYEAYNTVFKNNKAKANGGVVFGYPGDIEFYAKNCLFEGNEAASKGDGDKGGAISWIGGDTPPKSIVFENCAFINNEAHHGGAVQSESADQTFINCTFSGNVARGEGGVMWNFHTASEFTTTFINSTIVYNKCGSNDGAGGGLFMVHKTCYLDMQNTVLTGNVFDNGVDPSAPSNLNGPDGYEIKAKNSFYQTPLNMQDHADNVGNVSEGDTWLGEIDTDNGIYWCKIGKSSSVLVELGDPALLAPYSELDQRGYFRDMDANFISAGAYEYNGTPYDSVQIIQEIEDILASADTTIDLKEYFQVYLIPDGFIFFQAKSSDENIATVKVSVAEGTLTLKKVAKGTATITITAESDGGATNELTFDITFSDLTGLQDIELSKLDIWPNPATNYIVVKTKALKESKATIFNLSGKQVISQMLSSQETTIDVSELPAGVYIIESITGTVAKRNYFLKK